MKHTVDDIASILTNMLREDPATARERTMQFVDTMVFTDRLYDHLTHVSSG